MMNVTHADRRLNLREVGDMFWNRQIVCSEDYTKYFNDFLFTYICSEMFLLVDGRVFFYILRKNESDGNLASYM